MEPIRVRPFPLAKAFDTFEKAIAHAFTHPRLPEAHRDAARLKGAVFLDAYWTLDEWVIRFDCDMSLCVRAELTEVRWSLRPSDDVTITEQFATVGSPPVWLDWGGWLGVREMDCSALVAKRRGSRFKDLFVSEYGLFVYLDGHLILQLLRAQCVETNRAILSVSEDD